MTRADEDGPGTSRIWMAVRGATTVQLRQIGGVAVVTIAGRLDTAAVQPCRAALDVATDRPGPIIVDLGRAAPPVPVSVALLGAMRRYAATRGATITFTALPWPWTVTLKRARVARLYEVTPDLAKALVQAAACPAEISGGHSAAL